MDYTQQLKKRRDETAGMRPAVERGLKEYRRIAPKNSGQIDNLKIQDAYNEIARGKPINPESQYKEKSYNNFGWDSEYARPYGTIQDWLKLNNLNITPDEFRSNSMYQSAYKNWAESLKRKQLF